MNLDYKAIGQRIKIARIRKSITQDKVADITGLSNPHISNVETGSTKVSLPTLIKIANALEVSMDELLCDNLVNAKETFQNEIVLVAQDCNDIETRILADALKGLKDTLRMRIHTDKMETRDLL